jgi:outer membrane lipoprotein carrier protein
MHFPKITQLAKHALWLSLLIASPLCADNSLTTLQDTLNRYQDVTATFDQSTYDTNGSVSLRSSGSMALLRPGYFRWQTNKPNKQIISATEKELTIYDVDLAQASVQSVDKSVGEAPAALLLNSSAVLANQYQIALQPKRKPGLWYRLTPKGADAPMTWVDLQIDNQRLVAMQVMDNLGQLTAIHFNQQRFNAKLTPKAFVVALPKGVDVVREGAASR